jgi:MYXO-CTERM domain-containing protein
VDNAAAGSNAGTSWTDAWQSFADIDWSALGPGDTLYISGGSGSKTYLERLVMNGNQGSGVSGEPGNPVVITGGTDPGHDGTVIIDGEFQRLSGVFIWNHSDLIVRGLELKGAIEGSAGDGGGAQIVLRAATSVVIEDCNIEMERARGIVLNGWTSPDGFGDGSGANRNCVLRNNTITTPVGEHNYQTDGIYAQHGFGNVYEGTHLVDNNTATDAAHGGSCEACHNDCVQTFRETDATFIGNYCEQNNTKTAHCQGLFSTESFGTFVYYNNVIYYPHSHASVIGFRLPSDPNAYVYAYNNTLVANETRPFSMESDGTVMNNIFVTGTAPAARFGAPISDPSSIDYNIYFNGGGSHLPVYTNDSGALSWADWRAAGYEQHGHFIDPELDADFRPPANSPAIDSGTEIAEVVVDFAGTSRPQGQAYDIGAFEYCEGGCAGAGGDGGGGGVAGAGGGGTAGTGGAAGAGGSGGAPELNADAEDDGGCGCRTAPSGSAARPTALALLLGLLGASRRRRPG